MDESGRSAQPRSGDDEAAEQHAARPPRPTAPAHPDPGEPTTPATGPDDRTAAGDPEPTGDSAAPRGDTAGPATPAPSVRPAADAEQPAAEGPSGRTAPTGEPAAHGEPTPPGEPAATGKPSVPGDTPTPDRRQATPDRQAPADHPTAPAEPPAPRESAHPHADAPRESAPEPPHLRPHDQHPDRSVAHSGTGAGTGGGPGTGTGGRPPRPPEPRSGLLMGRPFGVPVYVAPSWFLVAALITWVFGGQLDRVLPELGAARYLVSLFFAVAFYASVLVHELAHTVAALRFKLPVRRIQLQFFGGVSEIEKEAETPGREFVLAFVGPLLSLVLAGVFYLAMQPVEPGTVPGVLLAGLMISNLIVAIFNLLPGLPLDGGRMLRAVVWKITGRPMSGTVAAAWVGRALAVSVLIGLPLLTQSGALGSTAEDSVGMDTVTDALLAAILAAIIWTGAGNSLRVARLREHLPELRARTLTRRAVPVHTETPLSEALRRANEAGARALVVVDTDGAPLSLVREAAIVGVPEHRRPWVPVSSLAQDITDGMRVSAELAGEDLLEVLRATPATEYLVVEETGEIYGVLSAADVERAFVKAMARPS
ncbi:MULTISPECIES: site-2 protease family protein [unclassified Streptomyces]|uniref:site-2 protease family protein n=1 Tax=unclassified Streptomyces TaxID=2593676 RepID=UPI0037003D46